ncbi:MAG: hypothetical protein CFE36_14345 [Sphingomonadaceae bacterium PASS1]|nr:MAG: hypothetical protein CFE36_14345 [Sphingomonadaceae bacterium PASS1]
MKEIQRKLKNSQILEFFHDNFVDTQVRHFVEMIKELENPVKKVIDIGGGVGFFAHALILRAGLDAQVIDTDPVSVAACRARGVPAQVGDALNPPQGGDEDIVSFNLILHHLVAASDAETEALQERAIAVWRRKASAVFVNEYIYDSYIGNASGWLIYRITSSRYLSILGQAVAQLVPSLRANTFGTGVRFRANREWVNIFDNLGYEVVAYRKGAEENVSLARRMLMIKSCRRDSYLLVAK